MLKITRIEKKQCRKVVLAWQEPRGSGFIGARRLYCGVERHNSRVLDSRSDTRALLRIRRRTAADSVFARPSIFGAKRTFGNLSGAFSFLFATCYASTDCWRAPFTFHDVEAFGSMALQAGWLFCGRTTLRAGGCGVCVRLSFIHFVGWAWIFHAPLITHLAKTRQVAVESEGANQNSTC